MQLVKAIAAVKGRSNKSLKGKWHTLWRGKTVYILSDITTMFKRVFSCFWRRVTVNWDWGEKHIELTNVRWCPCVSSKVESWTMATEGRAEQKDKWYQFTCRLAAQVSGYHAWHVSGPEAQQSNVANSGKIGSRLSGRHFSVPASITLTKHYRQPELVPKLTIIVVICKYYVILKTQTCARLQIYNFFHSCLGDSWRAKLAPLMYFLEIWRS